MGDTSVLYLLEGDSYRFETSGNLLNSALGDGLPQEYSCRVGMCLACSGRLVDANIDEVLNYLDDGGDTSEVGDEFGYLEGSQDSIRQAARALSEEEMDQGFVLTCVASPDDAEEIVLDLTSTLNRYPETI